MDRQLALGNSKIVFRPTLKLQIYRLSIFFFSVENTAKMSSPVIPIPAKMVKVAVSFHISTNVNVLPDLRK